MVKDRSTKRKKRPFCGNQHTSKQVDVNVSTSSSSKLSILDTANVSIEKETFEKIKGNRIIDIGTLISIFSILCCPKCLASGLKLTEDSKYGLCSNFALICDCGFVTGFTSTPKTKKANTINLLLVFGLRLIGRGFNAGKKLLMTLNLPFVTKSTFRSHELKLYEAVKFASEENMKMSSKVVKNLKRSGSCGVSVDE
ncbi:hypothetical protein AVEN_56881-1 [Araneus ventricosus]|uniref:Mutator-like transposase domain-containing protein n=1 Tax=Araneus ventricosus TaxID=182803 RepID=A0A4Y2ESF0_ARAVE|nr:hypothetical protein AVEN_56881-1 [Araneus ventricosus]